MAHGHPRPRLQPDLPEPNLPSPLPVFQQIPHRYASTLAFFLFSIPSQLHLHPTPHTPPRKIPANPHPESPEVTFIPCTTPTRTIPMHPHIYSNGIICLDLLSSAGWSPVQNVESICMSLQSMLTGNTRNERPPGDQDFVKRNTLRPRDIRFDYEDSTV